MKRLSLIFLLQVLLCGLGCRSKPSSSESTVLASPEAPNVRVVMASVTLQRCLGIVPGSERMQPSPATRQYCEQLPGASIYDQAGARFKAGDHAAAAQIVTRAAEMGNALAQLRLALMYDQGDGVRRSLGERPVTHQLRVGGGGWPPRFNHQALIAVPRRAAPAPLAR